MLFQHLKRFLQWKLKFFEKLNFFLELLCFNPFLSFATWYFFARPSFQTWPNVNFSKFEILEKFAVSKMHFSVLKAFYDRYKNYWNLKFFFAIKCYNVLFSIWIWEYYSKVTVIIIANSFLKVWNFKNFQPQNFHFNPVSMLSQRLKRFFKWKLKFWKVEFFFGTGMF